MDNATTTALALDSALVALQTVCAALRYMAESGSVQGIGNMVTSAHSQVDQASKILYPLAMNARSQQAAEQAAADAKAKAKLAEAAAAEAQKKSEEAAAAAKAAPAAQEPEPPPEMPSPPPSEPEPPPPAPPEPPPVLKPLADAPTTTEGH